MLSNRKRTNTHALHFSKTHPRPTELLLFAQAQTSDDNPKLKAALARFLDADANKDGVLTREEAKAFPKKNKANIPEKNAEAPEKRESGGSQALLELPEGPQYLNHIGTIHAGVLLFLTDAASGEFLMRQLGVQSGFIPVVRQLESKFRKPANGRIIAKASADPAALALVETALTAKGRVLLLVMVELYAEACTHVFSAKVEWHLQKNHPSRD